MIQSPNTVLANALESTLGLIRPRLEIGNYNKIVLAVGTQINGLPHIGTYVVQAAAFTLARAIRGQYGLSTEVVFGALDNAPFEVIDTPKGLYQIDWGHADGNKGVKALIDTNYLPYLDKLSQITGITYSWSTYSQQQATSQFRESFIKSLNHLEVIRWCVAPSSGLLRVRVPCPHCGYAQKYAEDTKLVSIDHGVATFACTCYEHGDYEVEIDISGSGYIDLNTLYRNVIKEVVFSQDEETLAIMIKGGDWLYSTQMIDWALAAIGITSLQAPMRLFTPQVLTTTGAKLSKSLIREGDDSLSEVPEWLLDMGKFRDKYPGKYADIMVWLIELFMSKPRHFYRSYSYQELIRLINSYSDFDLG